MQPQQMRRSSIYFCWPVKGFNIWKEIAGLLRFLKMTLVSSVNIFIKASGGDCAYRYSGDLEPVLHRVRG